MPKFLSCCVLLGSTFVFSACQRPAQTRMEFSMGEKVPVGQVTYSIVESSWRTQLGESFRVRYPEQRFLVIKISVTNGTGQDISIPLLTLENSNRQTYRELDNGDGVGNWFGLLRTVNPGQTEQGNIVFDVPLTSYQLRLPDVSDPGLEKYVTVQIPLRLDSDIPIQSPATPDNLK